MAVATDPFLVVGLGNPGPEYEATPHNCGFLVVAELARRAGMRLKTRECQAVTARGTLQGRPVWLAEPQTFMNLSGAAVSQLLAKAAVSGLLIAYDELDLPFGTVRLKESGSAGSHNGLRSLVGSLGTTGFWRVRLGIGPEHPVSDRSRYVLGPWAKPQRARVEAMVDAAADAVELVLSAGMAQAMNRVNARPVPANDGEKREL